VGDPDRSRTAAERPGRREPPAPASAPRRCGEGEEGGGRKRREEEEEEEAAAAGKTAAEAPVPSPPSIQAISLISYREAEEVTAIRPRPPTDSIATRRPFPPL